MHKIDEIGVLADENDAALPRRMINLEALRVSEPQFAEGKGFHLKTCLAAMMRGPAEAGRPAKWAYNGRRRSRSEPGNVDALCSEAQSCGYVFRLKIWKIGKDRVDAHSFRKHFKNIAGADAHSANAGSAAALGRVECNTTFF